MRTSPFIKELNKGAASVGENAQKVVNGRQQMPFCTSPLPGPSFPVRNDPHH
jgi:hypothetical protein